MIITELPEGLTNLNVKKENTIMTEFMTEVKTLTKKTTDMFHRVGFWLLLLILMGSLLGGYAMSTYQKIQMDNAILLGGYVYKNKVYNISERVK